MLATNTLRYVTLQKSEDIIYIGEEALNYELKFFSVSNLLLQ